jgi:hypothetical protein
VLVEITPVQKHRGNLSSPDVAMVLTCHCNHRRALFIQIPRVMLILPGDRCIKQETTYLQQVPHILPIGPPPTDRILVMPGLILTGQARQSRQQELATTASGCLHPKTPVVSRMSLAEKTKDDRLSHGNAHLRFRLWLCRRFLKSDNRADLEILQQTAIICRHRRERHRSPGPMILPLRRLSYSSDYQ